MPRPALLLLLLLVGGGLAHTEVVAYPTPKPVADRPELSFAPGPLRLYQDPLSDHWYWYFTYEVTNTTGSDQIWAPSFVLFTDHGEIMHSGAEVPMRITKDLMTLLDDPLLLNQYQVIGDIRQGPGHAKSAVVAWPALELNVNELTLFIAGVSSETATATNPLSGDEIILRKTLQRDYLVRGDLTAYGAQEVALNPDRSPSWILR